MIPPSQAPGFPEQANERKPVARKPQGKRPVTPVADVRARLTEIGKPKTVAQVNAQRAATRGFVLAEFPKDRLPECIDELLKLAGVRRRTD